MPRNFTVVDCEQRSPEWHQARCGRLTASVAADMLSKPLKSGQRAACYNDLLVKLAVERLTHAPSENGFVSEAMQRGIELEAEARARYEAETGEIVTQVGFVQHTDLLVGASPDGVIGDFAAGLEIKCPKMTTHAGYLRKGGVPPDYLAQITHTLWLTGAEFWDFLSYDPRFPAPLQLFRVRVYAKDLDLAAYELALRLFLKDVEREYGELAALVEGTIVGQGA